ncbi:alpha-1,2-fucosyltransferase [Mucilaginibacter sp.]|uniref:alpha-1,2-fucosyltransferase n=1 Tax=Mucilaginibacter sp. TaxID=1882438 RepID=UPI00260EBEF1|nr:alpha-1,2-fucosyltransferase [Mucilaginibacter sp.]MDB4927023.1 hypothetical protein [Mucilaginibacter sp.]
MVGINIQCRLGNQLFQYAFIKALSEKFNTSFYMNEKIERLIIADFFDLEGYHPLKNQFNKLLLKLESGHIFEKLQAKDFDTWHAGLAAQLTDHTIYNGYFQSEHFFKTITSNILAYIRVKKPWIKQFDAKYSHVFRSHRVITIHIRRGDYLNLGAWWADNLGSHDLSLPTTYYSACLEQVPDYLNYRIIFVSDDIGFVRSAFAHLPNAEFSDSDLITDFQLIMNADVCILSHSSFAWWAAYLNPKKSKKIFCPRYWLGFKVKKEYPEHIIPAGWKQITVKIN